MKKFSILLCFILLLNFSKSLDEEVFDLVYNLTSKIFKGMTKTKSHLCSDTMIKNKEKISTILKDIIKSSEDDLGFFDFLDNIVNYIKLNNVENINKCKLSEILELSSQIPTLTGIKNIGKSVENNNNNIFELIKKIVKCNDSDERLALLGKILSIILNFYVE